LDGWLTRGLSSTIFLAFLFGAFEGIVGKLVDAVVLKSYVPSRHSSIAVNHPDTGEVQRCSTSMFGWDQYVLLGNGGSISPQRVSAMLYLRI
jgi:hypothetical protein